MYKVNKRAQMETFDEQIQSQDEKDMSFSTDYIYSEEELITTIQKLTPQLKIIFNLYAIEERSIIEIAHILNMTEGGVKLEIFRARKKLKQYLTDIRQ